MAGFGFGWRNVSDRLEKPSVIESVGPFERRKLDLLEAAPRPAPPDRFCLIETVDGLGVRVAVLYETLVGSFRRLYPDFQPDNENYPMWLSA
jgi:hypothetical protein